MSDTIKAYKNGVEKIWSRKQWETLGSDKYGWEPVPQTPKEISSTITETATQYDEQASQPEKRRGRKPQAA